MTLPANIGLGWRGLPGTNTLAYFVTLSVTKKKVLTLTLGPNVIKLFMPIIDECS